MHPVTPNNETKYKIVECQDPSCNICTMTAGGGQPPSPLTGGIAVYTCSNPTCSLCAGDYSLLLDIVTPALTPSEDIVTPALEPQEDCFLQQCSRLNHRNTTTTTTTTVYEAVESIGQSKETGTTRANNKRKLPSCYGYPAKSPCHTGNDVILRRPWSDDDNDDDVNNVDELQLMGLALELELDKIEWLPDLRNNVITELYHHE